MNDSIETIIGIVVTLLLVAIILISLSNTAVILFSNNGTTLISSGKSDGWEFILSAIISGALVLGVVYTIAKL